MVALLGIAKRGETSAGLLGALQKSAKRPSPSDPWHMKISAFPSKFSHSLSILHTSTGSHAFSRALRRQMSFRAASILNYGRTAAVSSAQTPKAQSLLLPLQNIGVGGFGKVIRMWDVSTGLNYARKTPLRALESSRRD